MSDLFWPGDERAGELFTADSFLTAMTAVEQAWLTALVSTGIAPADAGAHLAPVDRDAVALGAEAGGGPVIPLVHLLRQEVHERNPVAGPWLHRGLTSQDVIDTALILCARDVLDRHGTELARQINSLQALVDHHRHTLMAGRTLTQFAVPITFGLKAAAWLHDVLDAADAVAAVRSRLAAQFGGAAGTMAATAELAEGAALPDPVGAAERAGAEAARLLDLACPPPWHTSRGLITAIGDALITGTDAWGHVAGDVITLSRPEIAELAEPEGAGRGASSTMPQKRNPVLSTLIRRAALTAPSLGAQLHLAAADTTDERSAGAWHTEWATLAVLARRSVVAANQATELLAGLRVDRARMRANLDVAIPGILAERIVPRLCTLATAEGPPLGPARARSLVLGSASASEFIRSAGEHLAESEASALEGLLDPYRYLGTTQASIDAVLVRAGKNAPEDL